MAKTTPAETAVPQDLPPPPADSNLPADATDNPPQPMRSPMDHPDHPLHHLRNCL